jgi:hypothetical protein
MTLQLINPKRLVREMSRFGEVVLDKVVALM